MKMLKILASAAVAATLVVSAMAQDHKMGDHKMGMMSQKHPMKMQMMGSMHMMKGLSKAEMATAHKMMAAMTPKDRAMMMHCCMNLHGAGKMSEDAMMKRAHMGMSPADQKMMMDKMDKMSAEEKAVMHKMMVNCCMEPKMKMMHKGSMMMKKGSM